MDTPCSLFDLAEFGYIASFPLFFLNDCEVYLLQKKSLKYDELR